LNTVSPRGDKLERIRRLLRVAAAVEKVLPDAREVGRRIVEFSRMRQVVRTWQDELNQVIPGLPFCVGSRPS
jgi:hypothetical protein